MYSDAFEAAVDHAMLYEVGGHWQLTPEVEAGLIETREQRKAVGYVDDPLDRGGETKFGIAKNANMDVDIYHLTWEEAKEIYFHRYWIKGSCDDLPGRVAVLHFDGCVNHGVGRANKFLQRALGLDDDGVVGPMTLSAANDSDPIEICLNICDQREQFYRAIVANKPNQSRFLKGWLRRINEMREFTCDPEREF
jgi:lysozyme family protein